MADVRKLFPLLVIISAACASRMSDANIDPLFRDFTGDVPGAAVAVVRDGRVIVRKAYGLADLDAHTAITPATNFRLASMTKQFTARAIALLVGRDGARGKLSLDDSVVKWLPSLPAYAKAITIRRLLTHTSGIPDYEDLIPKTQTEQVSDAGVLHLLEGTTAPKFAAGEKYDYSNSGYVLLGLVIERASGEPLGTFLQREVFEPAGMQHTVLMDRGVTIPNRSFGHKLVDGRWTRRDQSITSATRGDGAIYSSIDDLARWAMFLDRTPVDETTVDTDGKGVRYGFGWFVEPPLRWHTGTTTSFHNAIVREPEKRLTVIVLTNRNDGDPLALAKEVAKVVHAASP